MVLGSRTYGFGREKLRRLVRKHPDKSVSDKEIIKRRNKLRDRLASLREEQGKLMSPDAASRYTLSLPCHPEDELLCMPCDFDEEERLRFKLIPLAHQFAKLVKGKLFDAVRTLRRDVKVLTAARDRKSKHDRSQAANTRSMTQILGLQSKHDEHIQDYEYWRGVL